MFCAAYSLGQTTHLIEKIYPKLVHQYAGGSCGGVHCSGNSIYRSQSLDALHNFALAGNPQRRDQAFAHVTGLAVAHFYAGLFYINN